MLVDAAAGQRAGPSNGNRRANYYSFFLSCDKQEKQECSREGCVFFATRLSGTMPKQRGPSRERGK